MYQILFVDNHLLAVNKPAGILTQPDATSRKSLEEQCKMWIKQEYSKPGNVFLDAAHRIDKPVSGIVLFARTSKAVSRLKEAIRNRSNMKIYLALVEGRLPKEGVLEHYLVHEEFHAAVVPEDTERAKFARLRYRVLEKRGKMHLVEIELETGRYHQIRAQFAEIGCPIVGDAKYGSRMAHSHAGIALHHHKLLIPHPTKAELMRFESKPVWL